MYLTIIYMLGNLIKNNYKRALLATFVFILFLNNLFSAILLTVPLQLLAYHVALLKNYDIDKPRNLAKSVTVE